MNKGYSVHEAQKLWILVNRQLINGPNSLVSSGTYPMTPQQMKIRELENKIKKNLMAL